MDDILGFIVGAFIITVVICVFIFTPIMALIYYFSCRSADIYNAQHHTTYTCGDFFWASKQINAQTQTVHIQ